VLRGKRRFTNGEIVHSYPSPGTFADDEPGRIRLGGCLIDDMVDRVADRPNCATQIPLSAIRVAPPTLADVVADVPRSGGPRPTA
jgi:hypothetical protein